MPVFFYFFFYIYILSLTNVFNCNRALPRLSTFALQTIPLSYQLPLLNPQSTYLRAGLSCAVGAHKLHKLLKRVLVVMVAYGGVGEVRAGLLDDRGGGEMQG